MLPSIGPLCPAIEAKKFAEKVMCAELFIGREGLGHLPLYFPLLSRL